MLHSRANQEELVRQHSLWKIGAAVLAGSLALSACGSREEPDDNDSTAGSGGDSADAREVTIGVIAPLSGDLSALGLGIQNSVDLAIQQANESGDLPEGVELVLNAQDDQATPDVGQQAASLLADEETVVGVVGTLNSSVAQSVAPVLADAGITQVSPANTNPTLTLGEDWTQNPERVWDTYFRTCTTDNSQGRFAARYVYEDLGLTTVAVIHDQKTYGAGLQAVFAEEFQALGGTVTTTEVINPDEEDFSAVLTSVAATSPELVYYGGEYPQAGPLSSQMAANGLDVPLMGGDGIYDPTFIELGGRDGDTATSVGAPTEELDSAAEFVTAYEEAGFNDPYAAYGGYAYDSANAIIEAVKIALGEDETLEGDDLRAAVLEAMAEVEFDGATGGVSFDEFGDTTNRTLTVYEVAGGEWSAVTTGEYDPES
jgi:branched-chain amino acid transport system substrate-binding protein